MPQPAQIQTRGDPKSLCDTGLVSSVPFGVYVHVPFCATRCGYCDFNTYTPAELGDASPDGWLAALRIELALAARRVGPGRRVDTVFVGGGTPSMLGASGLAEVFPGATEASWKRRDHQEQAARLGQLQRKAFEGHGQ